MGSKNNRKDDMIEWRRSKVLELSSQGHNQSESLKWKYRI